MNYVSVVIVDKGVESKGILSNAAFVLGLTAGRSMPSPVLAKRLSMVMAEFTRD